MNGRNGLIRYYVYGLPKRIRFFFGALSLLIIIVAVLGVTTSESLGMQEKMLVSILVIAAVILLILVLKYKVQQAETYREAIEKLKQEMTETEDGVEFKKPMLVEKGTLTIQFNVMRSMGSRTAARKFDFKAETEPMDAKELKISEIPAFTLYKQPLTVVMKTTAWKLIDPEYGKHEVYLVLLPNMIYEEKTERFELTSGIRTIEVITRFRERQFEIIAEGSPSDEVLLDVSFGDTLVWETLTLRGGENTEIQLLPTMNDKAILVIHGKSVKIMDANYIQLAEDIATDLKLNQINASEYLATTEPITIKTKFKKTTKTKTIKQPIKTRTNQSKKDGNRG